MNTDKDTPSPANSKGHRGKFLALGLLGLVVIGVIAIVVGPRNSFGPPVPSARTAPPQDSAELEAWLQSSEKAYGKLKPGTAKGIAWADKPGERTPWSVVYLHGFSASRLETAPLADTVAQALGANAFHTRLSGHGLDALDALGTVSVQDWLADMVEALQIGKALGDKVLVIGVSTGATLTTWAALSPQAQDMAAMVFISPNFGPKDKRANLVNGPWGTQLALAMEGPTRGWTPDSPDEANAWTTRYPTRAVFPMMALVKQVRESALDQVKTPVLMLYSEGDEVVDPQESKAAFARMGSAVKSLQAVDYSTSKGQHVLAGAIKAPTATAPMAEAIVQWVKSLP